MNKKQAQNHVYQGLAPAFWYNSSNKGKEKDVERPLNVYDFCLGMYNNYSMNQLMLDIPTAYEPEENHPSYQINQLVESLDFTDEYTTGRYPYHPRLLLKLVLFAYTRGIRYGRMIERFADENKVAM